MKRAFLIFLCLVTLAFCANAQVRVGALVGATTSNDPNEAPGGKIKYFPGVVASYEGGSEWFEILIDGGISRPQLPTLFTTDEGKSRPEYEIRINPEFRLKKGKFFAGVGVDAFYHGGLYNHPGEQYSRSYGVNPTLSAGLDITDKHEISYTYLLRDKGTDLYGHRVNYFYTLSDSFPVRIGGEFNYLTFKERNREGYVDSYYEQDGVAKITVEFPLTKGKK